MKKVFFALCAIALLATGCTGKVKEAVTNFYNEKCAESYIKKQPDGTYKIYLKCKDLHETVEIKKYASEGKICYDFVNSELTGTVASKDSIPNMYAIMKGIAQGVKKKKQ